MELNGPSNGEKIAGVSAILLLVFMALDWFGSKDSGELRLFSVGRNAWEALDYIPIVLLIAIIAALGVVALRLTGSAYQPPVKANAVVAILGIVSVLLIPDLPRSGSRHRDCLRRLPGYAGRHE
ncbi:MAG TPA: hypothetical protein VIH47_10870 [Solirubrobacterales bacterium]